jgi:hypothetical protein
MKNILIIYCDFDFARDWYEHKSHIQHVFTIANVNIA